MDRYVFQNTRPEPMAMPPPKSIASPGGVRLSNLVFGYAPSPLLTNMPFTSRYHGDPPREDADKKPPSYVTIDEDEETSGGRRASWPHNLVKRGGWKSLALIALLVMAITLALGIGVGIGLNKKSDNSNKYGSVINSTAISSGSPANNNPDHFPLGSFSLNTFLDTVATNCTSNAATWNCYPYQTFSVSPGGSQAVFNWVITNASFDSQSYLISSTGNPFSIIFSDVPLTRFDVGKDSERYTFSTPMIKQVWPATALTSDNVRGTCFFNNTMLLATMYTKMRNAYPGGTSIANISLSGGFTSWPGAVEVAQVSGGGTNVPDCYETQNNKAVGSSLTQAFQAQPLAETCNCLYRNSIS